MTCEGIKSDDILRSKDPEKFASDGKFAHQKTAFKNHQDKVTV